MKLINFYEYTRLNSLLKEMGAELQHISNLNKWEGFDDAKLQELIETGEVEIDLDELEFVGETFEYKGKKVIVYIRDQYEKFYDKGYKFHVSPLCRTIQNSFERKRNSRFVVSTRTDGRFKINLMNDDIVVKKDLIEELNVCKNCLTAINYKSYTFNKVEVYKSFKLQEYFDLVRPNTIDATRFKDEKNSPLNVYNSNFKRISKELREAKGYICNKCNVNLSNEKHKHFAHVHHINGSKSDDSPSNLEVLCIECHSNKPNHERMKHQNDYHEYLRKFK